MDAAAVIARLREVDARSGGRRVAWTDAWADERGRLELVGVLAPEVVVEADAFAKRRYVLPGASRETVLLGSHSDCVPGWGWLDGILGVHAGVGVLAALAGGPARPRRTLAVVDWADEEGAEFGRSLLASSAALGALTRQGVDALPDRDIVEAHGFDPAQLGTPSPRLAEVVAAVELHVEQGPTLERQGRAVAAVCGCLGVRRFRFVLDGAAGHAGATPMPGRRDPARAVAQAVAAIADAAEAVGGLATVGVLEATPAIPRSCTFTLDLRHADADQLATLEAQALALVAETALARGCQPRREALWAIEPVRFDADLTARAGAVAGGGEPLVSGPVHDSAALAQAGIPATMLFTPSIGGISHTRDEDTSEADLVYALEAFAALALELVGADRAVC